MKYFLTLIALFFDTTISFGQNDTIKINSTKFILDRQIEKNDYKTIDTLLKIYRIENGTAKYLLKHYLYKDDGGDCNNLYWNIGTVQIQNDSLIFLTHYLQQRRDPIPEWRKQIYKVSKTGQLKLVFDKFKKYKDETWKKTNFDD